jgi:hypothetical protein
MALVKGTNCGFVTVAPTAIPYGDGSIIADYRANAFKDTAPTGAVAVTEIGWYTDQNTEEANFEVGIYDHNTGDNNPEAVVGSLSQTHAKGTTSGWKVATGLNISITAGTIYWLAFQLDNTATQTNVNTQDSAGDKTSIKDAVSALSNPWGIDDASVPRMLAIYAVYTTGGGNNVWLAGTIAGTAGLSAASKVDRKLVGSIAGVGGVSPTSKVERALTAILAGLGGLAGTAKADRKLIAALAGLGGVVGTLSVTTLNALAGVIAASGNVAGAMKVIRSMQTAIPGHGNLAGSLRANWALAGGIHGQGGIIASLSGVGSETGPTTRVFGKSSGSLSMGKGVSRRRVTL